MSTPPQVDIKAGLISNYSQQIDNLTISVDTFCETDRLQLYFGTDLLEYGILPVLISVENNNRNNGFLITPKNVSILGESFGPTKAPAVNSPEWAETATALGLGSLALVTFVPILAIPGIVALIAGGKKKGDIGVINENLKKKTLIERTVFPGEAHSGFAYFQFKQREDLLKVQYVGLTVKNLSSKENIDFRIKVKP